MRPAGAAAAFLSLALLLGTAHHSPGAAVAHRQHLGVSIDEQSPPGCLAITGKPLPATCEPCPPLWLGGPTVRCITLFRFKQSRGWALPSYYASRNGSTRLPLVGDVWGGGWLPACPGLPTLPMQAPSSRLSAWLCGTGFATRG